MATTDLRDRVHDLLVKELSDMELGPLSDTPYFSAEEEQDGMLSLYRSSVPGAIPDASVDVPQIVDALLPLFEKAAA